MDINEIKDPRAFATRTLTMLDGTTEEVSITNWHWRVWDETKSIKKFSQRALLEEVVAIDDGEGTAFNMMGFLEALVEIDSEEIEAEKATATS
jgi:hypothetical protein